MFGWLKSKPPVLQERAIPIGVAIILIVVGPWALFSASQDAKEHQQRPEEQNGQTQTDKPISNYCWVLATDAPSPRLEVIPCDHAPKGEQPSERGLFGISFSDALLILFNGMLALFTYRLWRSTDKLWLATKDAIDESRAASERQAKEFEDSFRVAQQNADATGWASEATRTAASATRESTQLLRENAQRQLRAYVMPIGGSVEIGKEAKTMTATITLKNSGQTPAYKMAFAIKAHVFETSQKNLTFDNPVPDAVSARTFLAPGVKHEIGDTVHLNDTELRMLLTPNDEGQYLAMVIIVGYIEYIDAFSEPRWTKFLLQRSSRMNDAFGRLIDKWTVAALNSGNETESG